MRKTKNPDFSSVAEQLSVRAISEIELEELKQYQLGLIDYLVYVNRANNNYDQAFILKEIRDIETYLKSKWAEYLNRQTIIRTSYK